MVTDTHRVRLELRRYAGGDCVTGWGYHNASVPFGEAAEVVTPDGYLKALTAPADAPWPTTCDHCPYFFLSTDQWQCNQHSIYESAGQMWVDKDLPPGAIREAWWLGEADQGPDGKAYLMRLPGEARLDWSIYGYSTDEPRIKWTVTGTLPAITVSPSVNAEGVWHGFINGGVLNP